jgi:hypothetical protein
MAPRPGLSPRRLQQPSGQIQTSVHHPTPYARQRPGIPEVSNWLSNRVFRDHDDIVDHCCHHWNRLIEQPWRIMSIGLREWANGF